ncbi:MAG: hypothetical protein LBD04_01905 [Synergistaceae bacterium]|nr:hypothetical protein [Synergistaceae bacterium]
MMVTTGKVIAWIYLALPLMEAFAPLWGQSVRRLETADRCFAWFCIASLLVDDALMYDFVVWARALFPMLRDVALALWDALPPFEEKRRRRVRDDE